VQPEPVLSSLADELAASLRAKSIASLDPERWQGLAEVIEQLRMLQVAEHSLVAGEPFPDFVLPDTTGCPHPQRGPAAAGPSRHRLLPRRLVPYCEVALATLETARAEVECR
jgi:hypothetical protein